MKAWPTFLTQSHSPRLAADDPTSLSLWWLRSCTVLHAVSSPYRRSHCQCLLGGNDEIQHTTTELLLPKAPAK